MPSPERPADPEPRHTIFISHSSVDDPVVRVLRQALEQQGYRVFEDRTAFDANRPLPSQIQDLLDASDRVLVLVSAAAAGSNWVSRELRYAAERAAIDPQMHIIPLQLQGATTAHLRQIFGLEENPAPGTPLQDYPAERLSIAVPGNPPRIADILGPLLARIEGRPYQAADQAAAARAETPLADLVLVLADPGRNSRGRPTASAQLAYYAPGASEPTLRSAPFAFTAPLGKIEADDLRFYLERYLITPFGSFTERKERIEQQFPQWGLALYEALLPDSHREIFRAWNNHTQSGQRRFTVEAPSAPRDPRAADNPQNHPAITEILGLPWELIHDGDTYLFNDGQGARVRRYLPGSKGLVPAPAEHLRPPLRVLIVCSRPETEGVDYIDHRVSTRPLVEALNALGELAAYEFLTPATLNNLQSKLQSALTAGKPYHIVHFDGHGVFDPHGRLGQLVFEAEGDLAHLRRQAHLVDAHALGAHIANQGVRLFFLEACQSAKSDQTPDASVAGRLLQAGVPSVAAMSHSVLVETARQFTSVFYQALVLGERVGAAMLAGQRALARHKQRGYRWEPDADPNKSVLRLPLLLEDWFVPVLYQHREDPAVLTEPAPSAQVQRELAHHRELLLGQLPSAPAHAFVGRSRELLAAERLLLERRAPWILFRGEGGEGKTTLAAELARWLVTTNRFPRAAFASVEFSDDVRALLCAWGEQLLPNQFTAQAKDEAAAFELLVRCLNDRPALLLLDNLESILPPPSGESPAYEPEFQQQLLARCRALLQACPDSKLILTSREVPPPDSGFATPERTLSIGRLERQEGIELVARVLASRQAAGSHIDPKALEAAKEEEIGQLVDLVQGHARALVLLTPELADKGLTVTTQELAEIMAAMDKRPGAGRETSLFASVELGLRRLPSGVRQRILPLGVVQGGGCFGVLILVLEVSAEECDQLCATLQSVGLAEIVRVVPEPKHASDFYLRLDPALATVLLQELQQDHAVEAAARSRWIRAYRHLSYFLYEQQITGARLAYQLTRLELPSLLSALRFLSNVPGADTEEVTGFAIALGNILYQLDRPAGLREANKILVAAATQPGEVSWSHAAFIVHQEVIWQLLDTGQVFMAVERSRALIERCENAGRTAFPEAAYDLSGAHWTLGQALKKAKRVREALDSIATAKEGFEALATADNSAARMASLCLTESALWLTELGQLDAAAKLCEEAIRRARARKDLEVVAVSTKKLGTIRRRQRNFHEALSLYDEAKQIFDDLGQSRNLAGCWHDIGILYHDCGNLEAAEQAHLQSLAIKVKIKDKAGEASSRGQLGNLYLDTPRGMEDAVVFTRQAAEIYRELNLLFLEDLARGNLAVALIKLDRPDEARRELARAFECMAPFGLNAEPWKKWAILAYLETVAGNPPAAHEAHIRAVESYAEVRRQGREITQVAGDEICAKTLHILTRDAQGIPQFKSELAALAARGDSSPQCKALCVQLVRLLDGARDESLWQAPDLHYADAAEILLLLERLNQGSVVTPP